MMNIDWAVLGQVAAVSVLMTVTLVAVFTVGILTGSRTTTTRSGGVLARSTCYACFALCATAVGYGIWIIMT